MSRPSRSTPTRRPSRPPSRASRPGTGCRDRRSPSPSPPRSRNPSCTTWTTATVTRSDFPAAPLARLGSRRRPRGPRLRHDQVLRRPHPGTRLRQAAHLPGRPGRPAQRGRIRLRAVGLGGWAAGRHFTGSPPHGVSCWYTPAGSGDLAGAVRQMGQTFGPPGRKAVVIRITTDRSGQKNSGSAAVLHIQRGAAWTVANWLVAHAQAYGLGEVRYAGYEWTAANGTMGWQPDPGPNASPRGSIVAG